MPETSTIIIFCLSFTTIVFGFGWWIEYNKRKGIEAGYMGYKEYFEQE